MTLLDDDEFYVVLSGGDVTLRYLYMYRELYT